MRTVASATGEKVSPHAVSSWDKARAWYQTGQCILPSSSLPAQGYSSLRSKRKHHFLKEVFPDLALEVRPPLLCSLDSVLLCSLSHRWDFYMYSSYYLIHISFSLKWIFPEDGNCLNGFCNSSISVHLACHTHEWDLLGKGIVEKHALWFIINIHRGEWVQPFSMNTFDIFIKLWFLRPTSDVIKQKSLNLWDHDLLAKCTFKCPMWAKHIFLLRVLGKQSLSK